MNLGNSFETPERCAEEAKSSSQCVGYFMHTADWDSWGCRCCTDDQPGEYNDEWSMYAYGASMKAAAKEGNVVIVKLPSTPISQAFSVELKASVTFVVV